MSAIRTRAHEIEQQASRALARGEDLLARQILARGIFTLKTRDALEAELAEARGHVARLLTTMVRTENRAWSERARIGGERAPQGARLKSPGEPRRLAAFRTSPEAEWTLPTRDRSPPNAYVPLAPGEEYRPVVPAAATMPEATLRSVGWGLFLCVVFTVASAYSGLKVGQVMEAAIPISILTIGLARVYRRRSTLLENVIITGIGGVSGSLAAGAIFTLPALYILKLDPHPVQTVFICLAGGCLGALFLIPLRRYFVRETHGQFPYPEATAITEVLVTGEKGGSQAKLLLQATGIAGVYDFLATTFHVWHEFVDFQFVPAVRSLADRARVVLNFDAVAFILGLGYVMGLRSSLILCAGGFLANFVLVPAHLDDRAPPRRRRRLPRRRSPSPR